MKNLIIFNKNIYIILDYIYNNAVISELQEEHNYNNYDILTIIGYNLG